MFRNIVNTYFASPDTLLAQGVLDIDIEERVYLDIIVKEGLAYPGNQPDLAREFANAVAMTAAVDEALGGALIDRSIPDSFRQLIEIELHHILIPVFIIDEDERLKLIPMPQHILD
jgi:hypothetical protein